MRPNDGTIRILASSCKLESTSRFVSAKHWPRRPAS
jgi:hypothetical protein